MTTYIWSHILAILDFEHIWASSVMMLAIGLESKIALVQLGWERLDWNGIDWIGWKMNLLYGCHFMEWANTVRKKCKYGFLQVTNARRVFSSHEAKASDLDRLFWHEWLAKIHTGTSDSQYWHSWKIKALKVPQNSWNNSVRRHNHKVSGMYVH